MLEKSSQSFLGQRKRKFDIFYKKFCYFLKYVQTGQNISPKVLVHVHHICTDHILLNSITQRKLNNSIENKVKSIDILLIHQLISVF